MTDFYTRLNFRSKAAVTIEVIGRSVSNTVDYFGSITFLLFESIKNLFTRPFYFSLVIDQIYLLGAKSFVLIAVTSISVGLVMALQFGFGLERFGGKPYVPKVVSLSIIRELGPVFTCLMLAGRVGSGIAAELGSMKVTQQIDAIRALGTSPIKKLVIPRLLALVVIAPVLTVMADMIGIFGGLIIAITELNLGAIFYLQQTWEILDFYDLFMGTGKTLIFAMIIALTGCHYGFNTAGGTQGVGEATTKSVVTSSVMIFIFDFVLTKLFWIFKQ
jgi:phospholipid/cholesterol/gamma-HCH transport system permease protein